MKIGCSEVEAANGYCLVKIPVSAASLPSHLWFRLEMKHSGFVTDTSDPGLVALMIPAMQQGGVIELEGPVSPQLFDACVGELQAILRILMPRLSRVDIIPSGGFASRKMDVSGGIATGFSGGVDSFCVIHDYFLSKEPHPLRLTHLLFNNVGQNGRLDEIELFESRFAIAKKLADLIGLPLIRVESNLDSFYQPFPHLHFVQTATVRNAVVGLLLQGGLNRLLYASTYSLPEVGVRESDGISIVDPLLLPLLSTESLTIHPVGAQYRRVDKLERIAQLSVAKHYLSVCVDHHSEGNCSRCQKCMRTMFSLDSAGVLTEFSKSFDVAAYLERKKSYILKVASSDKPFDRENLEFFLEKGHKIPLGIKLRSHLIRAIRNLRKLLSLFKAGLTGPR